MTNYNYSFPFYAYNQGQLDPSQIQVPPPQPVQAPQLFPIPTNGIQSSTIIAQPVMVQPPMPNADTISPPAPGTEDYLNYTQ